MHWGFGPGLWPLHLLCLVLLGFLIWGAISRFNCRGRIARSFPSSRSSYMPDALEILRQRYACGEINATTFDQMRERLESSGRPRD